MADYDATVRRDVAAFARRYFAGTITLDTFLRYCGAHDDPLVRALADALVHEPPSEGLLGLRERWWRSRFWAPVERLLGELDKGAEGQVPVERVYPRISFGGLVVLAAVVLWAGLYAARNLEELLSDIYRSGALSFWDALWRATFVGTMALLAAAGIESWIHRLQLYRTRKLTRDH